MPRAGSAVTSESESESDHEPGCDGEHEHEDEDEDEDEDGGVVKQCKDAMRREEDGISVWSQDQSTGSKTANRKAEIGRLWQYTGMPVVVTCGFSCL